MDRRSDAAALIGGRAVKPVAAFQSLSVPWRRLIALVVLPLSLILLCTMLVWPSLYAYQAQQQWRNEAARQLARQRGLTAAEPALRTQLDALDQSSIWEKLYRVSVAGSAITQLQSDVSAALTAAGARLQTMTPLPSSQVESLRRIGLRVTAAMTTQQLKDFLRALERHQRLLRVDRMVITAPPSQLPKENPTLIISMEVAGYEAPDVSGSASG